MAYTPEEKEAFATRLGVVRKALEEKGIRYYGEAAKAFEQKPNIKRMYNVLNGGTQHEPTLALLELVAGVRQPQLAEA